MTFLSLSNSAFIVSRQVLPSRLAPLTVGVCKAEEMEQNGVLTRTPSSILHDVELTKGLQHCSSHFSHLIPLFQHLGTFSSFPQGCRGALLCPVGGLLEPSGTFWNQPGQLHFSSQNPYWTLTEHSGTSWDRPSLPPETPAGTFQEVLEPASTSPQSPLSPTASTQAQAPNAAATEGTSPSCTQGSGYRQDHCRHSAPFCPQHSLLTPQILIPLIGSMPFLLWFLLPSPSLLFQSRNQSK